MSPAEEPNISTAVITYDASTLLTSWDSQDVCGAGSFASVRKCEHEELGEVVVKCFNVDRSTEKSRRVSKAVEREISVLKRLSHKNIVKILGITKWAFCVGIILEYVNGESLDDLLLDKTMYKIIPWHLRFHIFYDITNGLAYLHRYSDNGKAFVHGDLKPQNILLTVEFVAKIADFGSTNIARATATGSKSNSVASTGQHTPYYTAPEVLKNVLKKRKTSMDVYSIGLITYEICTRRKAFQEAVNPNVVIQAIIDRGQKPNEKCLRKVEESLQNRPNDLSIFIHLKNEMSQCWNTQPQDRPNICDVRDHALREINKRNQTNSDKETVEALRKVRRDKLQKSTTSTKVKLSEFSSGFQSVAEPHSAQQAAVIENDQTQRRTENDREERETEETALLERNDRQKLLEAEEQSISRCLKYSSWKCTLMIICFVFVVVAASIAYIFLLPSYLTHHELNSYSRCETKAYTSKQLEPQSQPQTTVSEAKVERGGKEKSQAQKRAAEKENEEQCILDGDAVADEVADPGPKKAKKRKKNALEEKDDSKHFEDLNNQMLKLQADMQLMTNAIQKQTKLIKKLDEKLERVAQHMENLKGGRQNNRVH